MTKQEFAVIAVAIKAAYPASKVMADEASMIHNHTHISPVNRRDPPAESRQIQAGNTEL